MRLYREVAPIIKRGTTRRFGEMGASWRHPEGWQGVVRTSVDSSQLLIVVHTFAGAPQTLCLPLPEGTGWQIVDRFSDRPRTTEVSLAGLTMTGLEDFSAEVLLLERK
jgi:alpha-galactosidase